MKASYQHLSDSSDNHLIHAFWVKVPQFGFHWHYHPELEITFVKQGRGTRMVGDNVSSFSAGDFVLMGSNLPHTWISDDEFNQSTALMEVAVLQFHPSVIGSHLLGLTEMEHIRKLMEYVDKGIEFKGNVRAKATGMLHKLITTKGIERFQLFLSLLDFLGKASQFNLLVSNSYLPPLNHTTEERILNVCRFIHDNFRNAIKLERLAGIANMNETSFCRFFRKSTGQTPFEYINDLRIGRACNLLMNTHKKNISSIAYESGFNSQTLFNRFFIRKKGMTPSAFRKQMVNG